MNNFNWIYPEKKNIPAELLETAGSPIVAKILAQRGIDTAKKAKEFLNPEIKGFSDPYLFSDMEKAVKRIKQAIENKEHVVIYGDFDCDGVTSTSLLYRTFKHIGADVSYYVPDRAKESHGLNSGSVCKVISSRKAKLIVTCDCGNSNVAEVNLAKGLGTDVIITDHHEAPDMEPLAYAIINPKSKNAFSEAVPFEDIEYLVNLAGVGVAYKLACALLKEFDNENFKDEIIYLVAIGTIADLVPMQGENRLLAKEGLSQIIKKQPPGLIKLIQSAGANIEQGIGADTIAFSVAPRINAAGRLETADNAIKLLTDDNIQNLDVYVKHLDMNNRNRQQLCETTFMEADAKISRELDLKKNKAVILYKKNWHPGVIGIVASKIVEKYYRPTFMISIDEEANEARCSARSIEGLNLYETLEKNAKLFKHYGGHALAAGFAVDLNTISIEQFVSILNNTVNQDLNPKNMQPKIHIDANIESNDLTLDFIEKINTLAPFGATNPPPVFSINELILKQFKTIGVNNNHLKIFFSDKANDLKEAVWWGQDDLEYNLLDKVDAAFATKVNHFMGKTSIQMEMKDIKKSEQEVTQKAVQESTTRAQTQPSTTQKSKVKWLDHRKKTNIQQSVSDYLKKTNNNITVFAENRKIIESLSKDPEFAKRLVNRNNIKKADQIMFYDVPYSEKLFRDLLYTTDASMVHIMPYGMMCEKPAEIIKTMSGMLKYAHTNKNGIINIKEIAMILSLSDDLIKECIKLLNKADVIKYKGSNGDEINFEFVKSTDLNTLKNHSEFKTYEQEVLKITTFRSEVLNTEIEKLQNKYTSSQNTILI